MMGILRGTGTKYVTPVKHTEVMTNDLLVLNDTISDHHLWIIIRIKVPSDV